MANSPYINSLISHEVEDMFDSKLDLVKFCTVDRGLELTPGMKRTIVTYSATNDIEKLAMGAGNTESIEVGHTSKDYDILLAQGRFDYFDEEFMTDPKMIEVGSQALATKMFNTVNADIFTAMNTTTNSVSASAFDYNAIVDAVAALDVENDESLEIFAFINPTVKAALRKSLKSDLQYVEAFIRPGYIGTVAGVNFYDKKNAADNTIILGTKDATTLFLKKGTEVENVAKGNRSEAAANIRKNSIFARKYYVAALTNAAKAIKITTA